MVRQGKTTSALTTDTGPYELQRCNRGLAILKLIAGALNREFNLDRALHVALSQVVGYSI